MNTETVALRSYRTELNTGHIKANSKVAESLYRKAISDGSQSVTAAIFWLKTRAHWKETVVSEVTHDVADPIKALLQRIADNGRRIHDPVNSLAPTGVADTQAFHHLQVNVPSRLRLVP